MAWPNSPSLISNRNFVVAWIRQMISLEVENGFERVFGTQGDFFACPMAKGEGRMRNSGTNEREQRDT